MATWTDSADARVTIDGKSLEYRCWGPSPADAPTLVMLHEGLGSVAMWRDLPEALAAATGFGVLAYSRAGYGRSDGIALPRPLEYQTQEAKTIVGPLLDALGVTQAVLMGHSDGATMAAIYAGSVSDTRVRGLILMAPHFFCEDVGIEAIKAAGNAFRSGDLREKLSKYHDDVDTAFFGWHDVWIDESYFKGWNVADEIDHWRIPVLAIQGREDAFGTLAQIDEIAERIYSPLETVILDDCGHSPHRDQPEKTKAAIVEFCARLHRLEQEPVGLAG